MNWYISTRLGFFQKIHRLFGGNIDCADDEDYNVNDDDEDDDEREEEIPFPKKYNCCCNGALFLLQIAVLSSAGGELQWIGCLAGENDYHHDHHNDDDDHHHHQHHHHHHHPHHHHHHWDHDAFLLSK